MTLLGLVSTLSICLSPSSQSEQLIPVHFEIINDDQPLTLFVNQGEFIFSAPDEFIQRDNAWLNGWYRNEDLTIFHDFDAPIIQSLTLYAKWDYLPSALGQAQLTQSMAGDRFESETVTLTLNLYEPLRKDVRYQWQAAPLLSQDFHSIGGATSASFQPFRNGTFQYRVRYRAPLYNAIGTVIDSIDYYSHVVTLTIEGQQTALVYYGVFGSLAIVTLLWWLIHKRKITFVTDGNKMIPDRYYHVGEDITLLPQSKKPGYRFLGWYANEERNQPFSKMRMPYRSLKVYAKFKKTKTNR